MFLFYFLLHLLSYFLVLMKPISLILNFLPSKLQDVLLLNSPHLVPRHWRPRHSNRPSRYDCVSLPHVFGFRLFEIYRIYSCIILL